MKTELLYIPCRCGHLGVAHKHPSGGEYCSLCRCGAYRLTRCDMGRIAGFAWMTLFLIVAWAIIIRVLWVVSGR